jgi:hypothetical protein
MVWKINTNCRKSAAKRLLRKPGSLFDVFVTLIIFNRFEELARKGRGSGKQVGELNKAENQNCDINMYSRRVSQF